MRKFGAIVKKARVKAGLTQKNVSEKLNYATPQFVSNWERGLSVVASNDIKKLAQILNIDVELIRKAVTKHKTEAITQKVSEACRG